MTDRHTVETITADALNALYEQLDAAEATESERQLAAAREALASATTRAASAEAQVKHWLEFIERFPAHMQFSLAHPDGTTEQLPCADWCYACRLERAEAFKVSVANLLAEYEVGEWALHSATIALRALLDQAARPAPHPIALVARAEDDDLNRVTKLLSRWTQAGPPPLGVSLARWWDTRLVELREAILGLDPRDLS